MKASDRTIMLGLVGVGVLAVFWFMLLAPKRDHAAQLADQVTQLQAEASTQEQLAIASKQAEADYSRNYGRLVVLGKAAPENGDTPSLLTQLTELSRRSGTSFATLTQGGDAEAAAGAAAGATSATAAPTQGDQVDTTTETANPSAPVSAPSTPVVATEAAASGLPLGATVGAAGLGVVPYTLDFSGSFFQIADLMERIDSLVHARRETARVDGQLLTVSGFTMSPASPGSLNVELTVASFVLPSDEGLTAGATPTAPAVQPEAAAPVSTPAPAAVVAR